jgi:hypothetical protein
MAKDGRVLLLAQDTRFCRYAQGRASARFKDMVLCETIRHYREGKEIMQEVPGAPAILIWGDGRYHHISNVMNMPGSVKYVFDNHNDTDDGLDVAFDNHNTFSHREGVIVRVCRSLGAYPNFSAYDAREDNALLHISMDLDFVKGFPALPWMSVGEGDIGRLCEYAEGLARWKKLVRLDIGGFQDMDQDEKGMRTAYENFYEPIISRLLPKMGSALVSENHEHMVLVERI